MNVPEVLSSFTHVHTAEELLRIHLAIGERLLQFGAADVEGTHLTLNKQCAELKAERDALSEDVRVAREEARTYRQQTETLTARCTVLESSMAAQEAHAEVVAMQQEIKVQEERRCSEDSARVLQKQIDTLEQQVRAEEHEKYVQKLQALLESKVRADVQNEELRAQNEQHVARVQQLEEKLRARDLTHNVAANLGDRLEHRVLEYLQRALGFMAEVTRTHANHCGDIWVRFLEDDLVIMIDAKNASEHAVSDKPFIKRQDREKFHQDIARNQTRIHGAILFAMKKVHVTDTVERYSNTVLFVGGGNMDDLLRGVLEVAVAARIGKGHATEHQTTLIVQSTKDVLEEVGQMYAHGVDTVKEIAAIADRYKARKRDGVLACVEKLQRVQEICPQIVPPTFAGHIQTGVKTTTAQRALKAPTTKKRKAEQ